MWQQLHFKESLLKQKSRQKWIKEGDSNSRFFHASLKYRRKRNNIVSINTSRGRVEQVEELKKEVKNHFEERFQETNFNRPVLDGVEFKQLSEEEKMELEEPFSEEEVKEAIWSCDRNKSPGPDGYNFGFLKACWETLREDTLNFLHEFHGNAILPKAITASFLALIPKSDSPQELNDYRLICLIGSLYKIVAKLLAKRIKKVIGKLISDCQTAFVPGRQILDGVLVINELIDLARKECLLLKVDFEKTYDCVSW